MLASTSTVAHICLSLISSLIRSPMLSSEFSQKSLKMKSRLLSKETNPSFRVYYGNVSSAVPFTWEIQPGTPKHNLCDNSMPPLTPPPSYYTSNPTTTYYPPARSTLFYQIINLIKKGHTSSSLSSSSSWSSTTSTVVPSSKGLTSFDDGGSPDSVMCFGKKSKHRHRHSGGALTVVIMKKAFLSIVGRRSG